MKLGSLFDGSGTCPLAARMCGIEPVWASEIEPFPIRVTRKNFPKMRHLGDITKINGAEIDPVDIITFGSPCQDLSVAGKGAGIITGKRSSLFFEAIRIIKEMRDATNGKYPRYAMWENVPGALSSGKGRDFLEVLRAFAGIAGIAGDDVPAPAEKGGRIQWRKAGSIMGDGFSVAWRILDAQYWGVPQRRRRIYLVADFGGGRAEEILFEREGLRGDFAQGAGARERAAADAAGSAGGSSERVIAYHVQQDPICGEVSPCLGGQGQSTVGVCMAGQSAKAGGIAYSETVAPTLRAGNSGTNRTPVICAATGQENAEIETDKAPTIIAGHEHAYTVYPKCHFIQDSVIVSADHEMKNGDGWREDQCYTLTVRDRHAAAYRSGGQVIGVEGDGNFRAQICTEISPCMKTRHPNLCAYPAQGAQRKYIVRRLTPLECCRLQGFPDDWTDGVEGSDTAKYKMWGNGMALPCVLYVMQGIKGEEK